MKGVTESISISRSAKMHVCTNRGETVTHKGEQSTDAAIHSCSWRSRSLFVAACSCRVWSWDRYLRQKQLTPHWSSNWHSCRIKGSPAVRKWNLRHQTWSLLSPQAMQSFPPESQWTHRDQSRHVARTWFCWKTGFLKEQCQSDRTRGIFSSLILHRTQPWSQPAFRHKGRHVPGAQFFGNSVTERKQDFQFRTWLFLLHLFLQNPYFVWFVTHWDQIKHVGRTGFFGNTFTVDEQHPYDWTRGIFFSLQLQIPLFGPQPISTDQFKYVWRTELTGSIITSGKQYQGNRTWLLFYSLFLQTSQPGIKQAHRNQRWPVGGTGRIGGVLSIQQRYRRHCTWVLLFPIFLQATQPAWEQADSHTREHVGRTTFIGNPFTEQQLPFWNTTKRFLSSP